MRQLHDLQCHQAICCAQCPCVYTQVIWIDAEDTVASSTASASRARPMLHPPKPPAPAILPPNKDANPAPAADTINVNKTVHPNAAGSSAHATATASQPTDNLPSDVTMSDATAAASSEQPDSIPSSKPQSSLMGADHTAGPFAATTVGNGVNVVGRGNVPQGKDLGVIGGASGKLSDAPGLLLGGPVAAAPVQRAVDSSTHAASTAVGLPVSASWQGKARLDQAAGSDSQEGKKTDGELAAQTGPVSPGGSLGSGVQGKKRKVPEATGGFLTPCVMLFTCMHARLLAAFSLSCSLLVSSFWKPVCHVKICGCTLLLCCFAVSPVQKPICHVYTCKTVGCLLLLSFSPMSTFQKPILKQVAGKQTVLQPAWC